MIIMLLDLAKRSFSVGAMTYAWAVGAGLILALVILLPRRSAGSLAALVVTCLIGASVLAQRSIDARAQIDRTEFFGKSPTRWIDLATAQPVAYLYNGDPLWNNVFQQLYWNTRLKTLALLPTTTTLAYGVHVSAC